MLNFDDIVAKTTKFILILLWVHVPLVAAMAFWVSGDGWAVPVLVALLCTAATITYRANPLGLQNALVSSAAFAVIIAVLVFMMRGHPWQPDMHMYFFAGLAITSMFMRWQAVLAFTAVVAVHHLALNFVMTEAVFPGQADLTRVLLHAGILLVEAIPLLFMTFAASMVAKHMSALLDDAKLARSAAEDLGNRAVQQQAQLAAVVKIMGTGLQNLSHGNLAHRIGGENEASFDGELRAMRDDFNGLGDKLTQTFGAIGQSAQFVLAVSSESAAAARDIAARAEAQANTVNQASVNIGNLNTAFGQTAALAGDANGQIQTNLVEVTRSSKVLSEAVDAMAKIENSARLIRQSVDAIDDIAFQTNLLALNAGVEAARAGDSASGFAVVAQEVRNLAQRASTSASEIRRLILDSDVHVTHGSTLLASTASALRTLMTGTNQAAEIVETIAGRARNQAQNLQNLTSGVEALEMSAQQFAGAAEETTASSESLRDQANLMSAVIAEFTQAENHADNTLARSDWDDHGSVLSIAS